MNVKRKHNRDVLKGTAEGTEIYMSIEDNKPCYKERVGNNNGDKRELLTDLDREKIKCFAIAMSIAL